MRSRAFVCTHWSLVTTATHVPRTPAIRPAAVCSRRSTVTTAMLVRRTRAMRSRAFVCTHRLLVTTATPAPRTPAIRPAGAYSRRSTVTTASPARTTRAMRPSVARTLRWTAGRTRSAIPKQATVSDGWMAAPARLGRSAARPPDVGEAFPFLPLGGLLHRPPSGSIFICILQSIHSEALRDVRNRAVGVDDFYG